MYVCACPEPNLTVVRAQSIISEPAVIMSHSQRRFV